MSIDVRVSHINVHQPGKPVDRRYNIQGVVNPVKNGGVGTLNEFGKTEDHAFLLDKRQEGIDSYTFGELAVLWDADRFDAVLKTKYRIMLGGHVGADGKPGGDDRRVGPSRWVLIVVLKDKATGITFQADTTHLVARADTVAKWRRGIRAASIRLAGLRMHNIAKKYPNGFLNGDMNYVGPRINWPYLAEIQLPVLRTMGNQRYDRAYVWGNVKLLPGTMKTFKRRSDHLGFTYVIRIGDGPSDGVPPVSHTGGGTVKPTKKPRLRPPVPRPWRKRTRRWKRRNRKLWRRIVAWRKRHPRR